jgi:hypothetical protein
VAAMFFPAEYTHMSLPAGMQIVHKEINQQEILGAHDVQTLSLPGWHGVSARAWRAG